MPDEGLKGCDDAIRAHRPERGGGGLNSDEEVGPRYCFKGDREMQGRAGMVWLEGLHTYELSFGEHKIVTKELVGRNSAAVDVTT